MYKPIPIINDKDIGHIRYNIDSIFNILNRFKSDIDNITTSINTSSYSFGIIGNIIDNVVADTYGDTLNFASGNSSLSITGSNITDTVTFTVSMLGLELLTDPGADRILFWDESDNALKWLTVSTGLNITGTTLTCTISSYTDEQAQDAVGNILTDSTSIDFTYNDGLNTITAAVIPGGVDHDSLLNFVANKHIDHSAVSITAGTGLTGGGDLTATRTLSLSFLGLESLTDPGADRILFWDESANAFKWLTVSTGLDITDTTLTCTITQYTDEMAQDAVGNILTDSASVNFTYDDLTNTITADVIFTNLDTYYLRIDASNTSVLFTTSNHYTGFPNRTDTSFSFNNGTLDFTITGSGYSIFINGKIYTDSVGTPLDKIVTLPDITGMYWIYYDLTGGIPELKYNSGSSPGFNKCLVGTVYWNTTINKSLVGDERHWMGRDQFNHEYMHETRGSAYAYGLTGTFTSTTLSITAGEFYDEDIEHEILLVQTKCDVLYKNGSSDYEWDEDVTTYYKLNGTSLRYNNVNALADVPNGKFVAMWIFVTNSSTRPIISIIGQRIDSTISEARTNNTLESLSLGTLPIAEMKILYRIILRQNISSHTYMETADYRVITSLPTSNFVSTDHLALTNLNGGVYTDAGHNSLTVGYISTSSTPSVNDDITSFKEGTIWIKQDTNDIYFCADNTDGFAVWNILLTTTALDNLYVRRDGTTTMLADWNAGTFRITNHAITVDHLLIQSEITMDPNTWEGLGITSGRIKFIKNV